MGNARLFVALPVAKNLKEKFSKLQESYTTLKWSNLKNIHLTLRFIGDVKEENIGTIRQALRQITWSKFSLAVKGIGVFQRKDSAVIWAGFEKNSALVSLKTDIDRVLQRNTRFILKKEKFTPHLTLLRMNNKMSLELKNLLKEYANKDFGISLMEQFLLIRSYLQKSGAIHQIVEGYPCKEYNCTQER